MNNQQNKIKYFAYIRKSSDREDAQTLSLDAQKRELKKFAERNNIKIVKIFEESASAYKAGRKKFNEMLERIEQGEADALLVYHLTRIARNSFDGGRVIYMMDEGLIKEIRTPEKSYYSTISDDKFMMQIHFAVAKKSSDDTSHFVKRDIQSKLLKGEYPISAPTGYLNMDKYGRIAGKRYANAKQTAIDEKLETQQRNFRRIEQDPEIAPIIEKLFLTYATGEYSINDMRKKTFEMGLTGLRNNTKLTKSTIIRTLSNPFYYGAIRWKDDIHEPEDLPEKSRHIGIISKDLFDKVQKILANKSKPRKQTHNYKYTGLIRCKECGSMITAEKQKGIIYYRCTKKKGNCSQPYLREDDLEQQFSDVIEEYVMPQDFIDWSLGVLNSNNDEEDKRSKTILAQQRKVLTQIEQQMSQLLKMKISVNNCNGELLSDNEYLEPV